VAVVDDQRPAGVSRARILAWKSRLDFAITNAMCMSAGLPDGLFSNQKSQLG
jgi:hypothetical protein